MFFPPVLIKVPYLVLAGLCFDLVALMIIPSEVRRKRLFRVTPTNIIFQSNEKEMTQCGPVCKS